LGRLKQRTQSYWVVVQQRICWSTAKRAKSPIPRGLCPEVVHLEAESDIKKQR